jgi:hypothetical protein
MMGLAMAESFIADQGMEVIVNQRDEWCDGLGQLSG